MSRIVIPLVVLALASSCAATSVEFNAAQCRVLRQMGVRQANQICRKYYPDRKRAAENQSDRVARSPDRSGDGGGRPGGGGNGGGNPGGGGGGNGGGKDPGGGGHPEGGGGGNGNRE